MNPNGGDNIKPVRKHNKDMSYYLPKMKCMYHIADGVLYYTTTTGNVYSREMCAEIDSIINTLRPVALKDGQKRFMKLIYENELVSINRYVMGNSAFKLEPEYYSVQLMDDDGNLLFDKNGRPVMSGQIIRYHGEVPNNQPNPTYYTDACLDYLVQHPDESMTPEQHNALFDLWHERNAERYAKTYAKELRKIQRRQYQREYARKRYAAKKSNKQ